MKKKNKEAERIAQKKYRESPKGKSRRASYKRLWALRKEYGFTPDDYNKLFDKQGGHCAICQIHQSECLRRLSVDHDHDTKQIRGLLCGKCNTALGLLNESTELLDKAKNYLNKPTLFLIKENAC